eukprot:Gregarina_sp_Poly_1__5498@NODE_28_length_19636_cov_263_287087_g25_i0_p13_GENE_NODE_28_length_19636_cov_263_287087_g25_i0NODE_28_length_19636_cov_263_287087_g25_i0_p13_ORF_typecomplete_len120_score6_50DarT/PF14487_6/0_16_NODE_28_length_19636_cov_263_287087_g25_i033583717
MAPRPPARPAQNNPLRQRANAQPFRQLLLHSYVPLFFANDDRWQGKTPGQKDCWTLFLIITLKRVPQRSRSWFIRSSRFSPIVILEYEVQKHTLFAIKYRLLTMTNKLIKRVIRNSIVC